MATRAPAENVIRFLRQISLFQALELQELVQIAALLQLRRFGEGEVIGREDEESENFSILYQGQVAVIKAHGTTEERLLSILHPGEFFGEMSIFYSKNQRSATLIAQDAVELLEIDAPSFLKLLHSNPDIAYHMMQEMAARLRNIEDGTIGYLKEKNRRLSEALQDLKLAQEQLILKEKIEHELSMARQIQQQILPKEIPDLAGWEINAHWEPARMVSGDFYDFLPVSERLLALVIGDVTGKGMPASLVMATTCSVLRATIYSTGANEALSPGEVMQQVNTVLCRDMPDGMFATCLLGLLDLNNGEIRFANAGHNLPILLRRSGPEPVTHQIFISGMPLGLMPDSRYDEQSANISQGDCLILLTDGLVEAHNPEKQMFGNRRLEESLFRLAGSHPDRPPTCRHLIQGLLDCLSEFTGTDYEQEDDVTLLTIERT